ncbi:hypothetical protein BH18THE1_BH18THE1_04850 [soil metagenome]
MSENRFVSGNIIIIYCNFVKLESNEQLPEYVVDRISVCNKIFERVMKSKPDKSDTSIRVVADTKVGNLVKNILVSKGIEESKLVIDSSCDSVAHLFSKVMDDVKKRSNPPVIYFISSYQQKDIFDVATANYKGYKIQFEGAFDKRPSESIQEDAKREKTDKRFTNIKEKGKNRMVDMLLNYIFPESKK